MLARFDLSWRNPGTHAKPGAMRALGLGLGLFVIASLTACSGTTTGTGGGGSSSGSSSSSTPAGSSTTSGGEDTTTASGGSGFAGADGNTGTSSGSAGPSPYDSLFDAPANTTSTPGSVYGLWAGTKNSADVRVQLSSTKITIAVRCAGRSTYGVDVAGQVSSTNIKIIASKLAGTEFDSCGVKVTPVSIPVCKTTDQIGCFTIEDSTLSFVGVWLFSSGGYGPDPDFTKLSD